MIQNHEPPVTWAAVKPLAKDLCSVVIPITADFYHVATQPVVCKSSRALAESKKWEFGKIITEWWMWFFELSSSNYGNKKNEKMSSIPTLAHGHPSILPPTQPMLQDTHTPPFHLPCLSLLFFPQYKFCISSLLVIFPTGLGV